MTPPLDRAPPRPLVASPRAGVLLHLLHHLEVELHLPLHRLQPFLARRLDALELRLRPQRTLSGPPAASSDASSFAFACRAREGCARHGLLVRDDVAREQDDIDVASKKCGFFCFAGRGKTKKPRRRPAAAAVSARARAAARPLRARSARASPREPAMTKSPEPVANDADARDAESPAEAGRLGDSSEKDPPEEDRDATPEPPAKRPRGRPKGSKNKPKDAPGAKARPEKHARAA